MLKMANFAQTLEAAKRYFEEGDLKKAAEAYSKCVELDPSQDAPLCGMAEVFRRLSRNTDAIFCLEQALKLKPDSAIIRGNLGIMHFISGDLETGRKFLLEALEIKPNEKFFNGILGNIENKSRKYKKAIDYYLKEMLINPDFANLHYDLASVYKTIGKIDIAIKYCKKALELNPQMADAKANLMTFLLYSPNETPETVKKLAAEYCQEFVLPRINNQRQIFDHSKRDSNARRIKIGFLTGDFHRHPIAYFLEGLVSQVDKNRFELFAYDTKGPREYSLSKILCANIEHWRSLRTVETFKAAEMIYSDGIDILMDLSGHTFHNRLDIFVLKPAPVQASWIAYPSTTGIPEIDYVIVDGNSVRTGEEKYYTEQPFRLNCSQTPFSIIMDNEISEAPYNQNSFVTFGCFNNFSKTNDEVLKLWREILKQAPKSKLMLKTSALDDQDLRKDLENFFEESGINAERLILQGGAAHSEFIKAYHSLDIALDVFPYCGGITSVEALMMGVPIITLEYASWQGRVSANLLRAVHCDDLIAQNYDEYIKKAVALAQNHQRIDQLRRDLRTRCNNASCNAEGFTKELEKAWESMISKV
jgi:predicted O-linked N-acetylglucosamine transferase (SPINDLY family)